MIRVYLIVIMVSMSSILQADEHFFAHIKKDLDRCLTACYREDRRCNDACYWDYIDMLLMFVSEGGKDD